MKRIVFFIALGILLIFIYNLSFSIYNLWQKRDVIARAQKELEKEKRENTELVKKYETARKPEFIEEEARNKLFLVKPGESEVILPELPSKISSSSSKASSEKNMPNWKKWWSLFF